MDIEERKLMKMQKVLETVNEDYATTAEVADTIKAVIDAMKEMKNSLEEDISSGDNENGMKIANCMIRMQEVETSLRNNFAEKSAITTLRSEIAKAVQDVQSIIASLYSPFDPSELQNQIDVLMAYESPKTEATEVRDLLETLKEDERLDASAIKNLPERTETIVKGMNKVMNLFNLLDVDVAGITAGQSIQWDGNKWVAFTPAGSGGTPVWGEDLTPQGAGTSFTLAHTPISGTVRLFRGGAYQSVANGDYSITSATITLTSALQSGEVLVVDYSYL